MKNRLVNGMLGGAECYLGGIMGLNALNLSNFWTTKYNVFLELYLAKASEMSSMAYLQAAEFAENYTSSGPREQFVLSMVGGLAGLLFADGILRMHRAYGMNEEKRGEEG